jgi:hypothetical protein
MTAFITILAFYLRPFVGYGIEPERAVFFAHFTSDTQRLVYANDMFALHYYSLAFKLYVGRILSKIFAVGAIWLMISLMLLYAGGAPHVNSPAVPAPTTH